MRALLLLPAALLLLLAACGGPPPQDDPQSRIRPFGADEKWSEVAGRGFEVVLIGGEELVPESYLDLHLSQDWKASGTAGCNTWFAVVAVRRGNRIRFNQLSGTRRECPDEPEGLLDQEARFFSLLRRVDSFDWAEGELVLYAGQDPVLVLLPKRPRDES